MHRQLSTDVLWVLGQSDVFGLLSMYHKTIGLKHIKLRRSTNYFLGALLYLYSCYYRFLHFVSQIRATNSRRLHSHESRHINQSSKPLGSVSVSIAENRESTTVIVYYYDLFPIISTSKLKESSLELLRRPFVL